MGYGKSLNAPFYLDWHSTCFHDCREQAFAHQTENKDAHTGAQIANGQQGEQLNLLKYCIVTFREK